MRKQLLLGVMTALGMTVSMQSFAQDSHFSCGIQHQLKKLYAEDPQMEADYRNLVNSYKETRMIKGKKRTVYVIPIVFHIVHEYGAENVTDAQIYDQMAILNRDYQKLNADTADVVPQFDTIIGNPMIEFRLATIDPYGNCTNGIEHIYSHQTNAGDDYSKLNQWYRNRYLNVWVVKTIGEQGVAGYAYYPTATTGSSFFRDGIIILNNYVGSSGTSSPYTSRALTHEIGHYLGLSHTWGSTNDPGVACGDDSVDDTPMTKGHDNCSNVLDETCTPGVVENVQNYMEYSYCSHMFTNDQVDFMHNVLSLETGGRNNLYTADNLVATGTRPEDVISPPTCVPVADFHASTRTVCAGQPVSFFNDSWRAGITSFQWTFEGGTPATSTDENPEVVFNEDGMHDVTLTVTNAAGSDTKTFTDMVYASGNWAAFAGPYNENFDGASAGWWVTQNPENNHASFMLLPNVGRGSSKAFMLNNYKDVSNAEAYTTDWFYYDRLGGSKDYLISPSFDLSNTTNVNISFDYAYGTKATTLDAITEEVHVYSSRDCGETWQLRSAGTIDGADIVTAGYQAGNYTPSADVQWVTKSFSYTPTAQDTKVRFRFEFVASDKSSNFFFDNFNISGTLGISENGKVTGVSISPNPVNAGSDIAVQIDGTSEDMQLQVVDVNGAVISVINVAASNGTQTVMVPMNVAKGCYFLNAVKGTVQSTHRVIVF